MLRNENKQASETKKKYTQRERAGANDIIFIFVNEFRTHKKKLLTSAVLYYFSVSRCRQSNLLFTRKTWEDADEHKRRLTKLNENQINKKKQFRLISFQFFNLKRWKRTRGFIALLLNHHRACTRSHLIAPLLCALFTCGERDLRVDFSISLIRFAFTAIWEFNREWCHYCERYFNSFLLKCICQH